MRKQIAALVLAAAGIAAIGAVAPDAANAAVLGHAKSTTVCKTAVEHGYKVRVCVTGNGTSASSSIVILGKA